MKKQIKKGMTLVEVMIVITIIGILSSITLVGINSARQNSRNKAAYMQIMSTQPMAYKCIKSSSTTVTLTAPGGTSMCSISGYSNWPDISSTNWSYSNFSWCNITTQASCGSYADGSCGGSRTTGKFCYKLTNNTGVAKTITCTQDGCTKSGF